MPSTRTHNVFIICILIGLVLLIVGLILLPAPASQVIGDTTGQSMSNANYSYTLQVINSKEFIVIMVGAGLILIMGCIWSIIEYNLSDRPIHNHINTRAPVLPISAPRQQVPLSDKISVETQTQKVSEKSVSFVDTHPPQFARVAIHALPKLKVKRVIPLPLP